MSRFCGFVVQLSICCGFVVDISTCCGFVVDLLYNKLYNYNKWSLSILFQYLSVCLSATASVLLRFTFFGDIVVNEKMVRYK